MKIEINTSSYNERRYGRPWIARVTFPAAKGEFAFGEWVGQPGDPGLPGYGQVMRPCKSGGSMAVTYRAALDVVAPDLGDEHRAALQQRAADESRCAAEREAEYCAGYAAYAPDRRLPDDYTYDFGRGWQDAKADAYLVVSVEG